MFLFANRCTAENGIGTIYDPKHRIQPGPPERETELTARHLDDQTASNTPEGAMTLHDRYQPSAVYRADAGRVQRDTAFAGLMEPVDELDQIIALAANQRALETDNCQPMCNRHCDVEHDAFNLREKGPRSVRRYPHGATRATCQYVCWLTLIGRVVALQERVANLTSMKG
jgi:hypothetical protein